jgi:uncharacterized protein with GYD domain
MPKYLVQASYTVEGIKGLVKDGGSKRRAVLEQLIKDQGGTLEAFYFAFGENDVYAIADLPDNVSIAAISLAVGASGAVSAKTTVLITPEEMDQAAQKTVNYRPPGQ